VDVWYKVRKLFLGTKKDGKMKRYYRTDVNSAEVEITEEEYIMYKMEDRDEFWIMYAFDDEQNRASEVVMCSSIRKTARSVTRVNLHENKDKT